VWPARGLLLVVLLVAVTAVASILGTPVAAAEGSGRLRIAHLSPDTPAVDVAVAPLPQNGAPLTDPGPDLASDLGYGSVSDFADLPPGSYAVSVRAAGSGRSTPPSVSTRVELPAGTARTVTVSGRFAELSLRSLADDLSAPPEGSARVRVLAAAGGAAVLDVAVEHGPVLAAGLPFGAAGESRVVPAGPSILRVDAGSGAPAGVPVEFTPGSVSTVLVLDRPEGGLDVRVVLDAVGATVLPSGGVEAGAGAVEVSTGEALTGVGAAVVLAVAATRRRGRALLTAGATALAVGALPAAADAPASAAGRAPAVAAPPPPRAVAAPTRLQVPSAGVDTVLGTAALDRTGALVPPGDPASAGWFPGAPAPGETGPAVITGHVDWAGAPAVFSRLASLPLGAEILVGHSDGTTTRFTVTRVARHAKTGFPTAAVYGPTPRAELRLITCGGAFDRTSGSYRDNVVVYARGPVPVPP
jgi:hypothetical protein